jgi:hypothetical protein
MTVAAGYWASMARSPTTSPSAESVRGPRFRVPSCPGPRCRLCSLWSLLSSGAGVLGLRTEAAAAQSHGLRCAALGGGVAQVGCRRSERYLPRLRRRRAAAGDRICAAVHAARAVCVRDRLQAADWPSLVFALGAIWHMAYGRGRLAQPLETPLPASYTLCICVGYRAGRVRVRLYM